MKKAKNFQIVDFKGQTFDLFKFQKRSWLLLVFFRGIWCNVCKKQLTELNRNYHQFKKRGVKIVALSTDSLLNTSLLYNLLKCRYPLLNDLEWKAFKLYGFRKVGSKKIKPALFLISPNRKIVYSYIGKDKDDRPTIKQIFEVLNKKMA